MRRERDCGFGTDRYDITCRTKGCGTCREDRRHIVIIWPDRAVTVCETCRRTETELDVEHFFSKTSPAKGEP